MTSASPGTPASPGWRDALFVAACTRLAALTADFHRRGWTPATSSNFSFRIDTEHCAVSASGGDKSSIRPDDLLVTHIDGRIIDAAPGSRPSAEAGLHQALYRRDPTIGAVLHTHAPRAVIAARVLLDRPIRLRDYELLKAFDDIDSHDAELSVPVIGNDQDISRLARAADSALSQTQGAWAYLIAGHGVYAWGRDLDAAARHLEALDYLLGVELELARHQVGTPSA